MDCGRDDQYHCPMLSAHGFHYGSDMAFAGAVPRHGTHGPATGLQAPAGKYWTLVEVTFPWEIK